MVQIFKAIRSSVTLRSRVQTTRWLISFVAWSFSIQLIWGADDFNEHVRPLFKKHCVACHGLEKSESGLRLDVKRFAEQSKDQLWKEGYPDASPIMERVKSTDDEFRMPPSPHERLSATEIETLRNWIEQGCLWTETDEDRNGIDHRQAHWAWQPLIDPNVVAPAAEGGEFSRNVNPIDSFIEAGLRSNGLENDSSLATRAERIRRLYYDLTGLPPTLEQVQDFEKDPSPDAWTSLIDKVLNSPEYGERWAQHWLDIAHYADTHGFERDQKRENAWRYRDYVIQSFISDKPYNEFIFEQIAGDTLSSPSRSATIATGFLSAGPWDFVGQVETPSPQIKKQARADDLDDMVTQVMTSTCGISINCARCHNHKLDPITQKEYYQLWSIFSGAKRGDRDADPNEAIALKQKSAELESNKTQILEQLSKISVDKRLLALTLAGSDGRLDPLTRTSLKGLGIHPRTGVQQNLFLEIHDSSSSDHWVSISHSTIDGIGIPNGRTQISSTGIGVDFPQTSGLSWDAIRNGPVNQQKSTSIGNVDFTSDGHTILGIHANALVTWNLSSFRSDLHAEKLLFETQFGYGGRPEGLSTRADVQILLDGVKVLEYKDLSPTSGEITLSLPIPKECQYLSVVALEGQDGIGHDQIFLGDPLIRPMDDLRKSAEQQSEFHRLQTELDHIDRELKLKSKIDQVYAITSNPIEEVFLLERGSTLLPGIAVEPGFLDCIHVTPTLSFEGDNTDNQRRRKFATWLTLPSNPLPPRVIVNRLWLHHFGAGIVDTPNDFGIGGARPTHPELLDWLACELIRNEYSLKSIHRLICMSRTYQQSSLNVSKINRDRDSSNQYLWRQNPIRIDAETLRDTVLLASGMLNRDMLGPGFEDFDYLDEYAPIYRYKTPNEKSQLRRSIYRFVVRTTPHPFLSPLDCPDPANLTPKRNTTTTAIGSLAVWNNGFVLQRSKDLAHSLLNSTPSDPSAPLASLVYQIFGRVLSREPTADELKEAIRLLESTSTSTMEQKLADLCRVLFNSNEFIYVD